MHRIFYKSTLLLLPFCLSISVGSLSNAQESVSATSCDDARSTERLLQEVRRLDVNETCSTELQQRMAIQTLKWFEAYKKEDLDAQLNLLDDDFKLYHSALVRFVVLNPKIAPYLRWGAEPVTKANYRGTLAQLIAGEDQSQPGDTPEKITCGKNNDVVVNIDFRGYKVSRDVQTGCITHRAPYGGPTTKTFVLQPETLKIKLNYVDFDGNLADEARARLANMSKESVLPAIEATCRTDAQTDSQYGVPLTPRK